MFVARPKKPRWTLRTLRRLELDLRSKSIRKIHMVAMMIAKATRYAILRYIPVEGRQSGFVLARVAPECAWLATKQWLRACRGSFNGKGAGRGRVARGARRWHTRRSTGRELSCSLAAPGIEKPFLLRPRRLDVNVSRGALRPAKRETHSHRMSESALSTSLNDTTSRGSPDALFSTTLHNATETDAQTDLAHEGSMHGRRGVATRAGVNTPSTSTVTG